MPLCRRLANSALSVIAGVCLAMPICAQQTPGRDSIQQKPTGQVNAREAAAAQGDAAMDRLKGAVVGATEKPGVTGPGAMPVPTNDQRRRAFDAMRGHVTSPAMEARAREALKAGDAVLDAERERQAKRIAQALGLEAPDIAGVTKAAAPAHSKAWVPVLFVSSSMPVAILRTYAGQLARVGGVMAFRGMPDGLAKVAPMAKLSAEILRLDPGCEGPACAMRNVQIIVDPIVFRQHGVSRVPGLAMIPGDPAIAYCERDDASARSVHIVYGDAALSGLLDEYARMGGDKEVRDAQARLER